MALIDSHAHLDFEDYGKDLADTLRRARDAGIVHIVVVGQWRAAGEGRPGSRGGMAAAREADADTADILERESGPERGVIHCFTGDWAAAQRYLALGMHISLSGVLTFKAAEALRDAAARIPLDRLLVETDCPFLSPVPHRGKRNEPAYVRLTAERLAEVRGLPLARVELATTENARRALRLPA